MAGYILFAVSLMLAVHDFLHFGIATYGKQFGSYTAIILHSLTYAFTPCAIGLLAAYVSRLWARWRKKPHAFYKDWYWVWGIFLALLIASHTIKVMKASAF